MIRKRGCGLFLAGALLFGLVLAVQETDLPAAERATLIEVHGPNIACVPMTERFVTYDGKIRKITKFTAMVSPGDCRCPKCCDGECYVIIYVDQIILAGPVRFLYYLWMEC